MTTRNRNTAARSLTRSAVAELVGDRHADAALDALAWEAKRVARRARVLALAGLAALLLAGRRYAGRGASAALSLARQHYPAVRDALTAAAAVGAGRAAAGLAWLLDATGRLWDAATVEPLNAAVAGTLERCVGAVLVARAWARRQPARLAALALAGSVAGLAVLLALWDAAR